MRTCARHFSHASASAARHAFRRAISWRHFCASSFSGRYLLRYSVLNCCSVFACSSRTWAALKSLNPACNESDSTYALSLTPTPEAMHLGLEAEFKRVSCAIGVPAGSRMECVPERALSQASAHLS